MSILAWIEDQRRLKLLNAPKYNHPASDGSQGLWTRCDNCGVILYIKHLKENQRVCFGCGFHLQMNSQERIENLIDLGTWRPFDETLSPCDPLEFRDQKQYTERLREAQERTGLQDAIQTGTGMLDGIPIALGVMDFHFMGGSMGSTVGEKITRLIEYATQEGLTLILVCASGGARMQEGILSLMQMAKISAALQVYQSCAHLLYISVLTSPTTGGVTASFAMLGDLIFAEPKALIGFAGRRVIEQTLQEQLPDDFQTSEYLLHHGLLDLIVPRSFLKQALSETMTLYKDAPLKLSGRIPHGVQHVLGPVSQEKVRRKWLQLQKFSSGYAGLNSIQILPSFGQETISSYSEGAGDLFLQDVDTVVNPVQLLPQGLVVNHEVGLPLSCLEIKQTQDSLKVKSEREQKTEFSYREILLSFHTMFQFISEEFIISNKLFSLSSPAGEVNQKEFLPEVKTEGQKQEIKSFAENNSSGDAAILSIHKEEPRFLNLEFLNRAIFLASNETIKWRTFYINSKGE